MTTTTEKFTELPPATTPLSGSEITAVVQSGVSKQVAISAIGQNGASSILVTANPNLPNSRVLTAGTGVSIADSGPAGAITISATGSSVSPANPSASVGPTTVNGIASTFMRSDAAPAINLTANYTWTGNHVFTETLAINGDLQISQDSNVFVGSEIGNLNSGTSAGVLSTLSNNLGNGVSIGITSSTFAGSLGTSQFSGQMAALSTNDPSIPLSIQTGNVERIAISGNGSVINLKATAVQVNGVPVGFGTVTSVGISVPSFLSVSGSPLVGAGTLAITYSGSALPIANGGTGTATPRLVAGTGISISGSWPNQTVTNSASNLPAGSDTQVQYNNGGVFGASSKFTYEESSLALEDAAVLVTQNVDDSATGFFAQNNNAGTTATISQALSNDNGDGITIQLSSSNFLGSLGTSQFTGPMVAIATNVEEIPLSIQTAGIERIAIAGDGSFVDIIADIIRINGNAIPGAGGTDFSAVINGFNYTLANHLLGVTFVPLETLATGTFTMPANPTNGQVIEVATTNTITVLTVSANSGQSINNAVTTLTAGAGFSYKYRLSNTTWYRRY